MRDLLRRGFRKRRIKEDSFCANCINDSYEFVYNCYHCFLVTAKIFLLTQKVSPEVKIPFHYTYSHLEKNISEETRTLLRYTHPDFILTRLFFYWVCASVFYKLFCIGKSFYISNFNQKEACKFWRNTFYRGNEFNLFLLVFIQFLYKHVFKLFNSWFKEEKFFDVEYKGLRKIGVIDTDGVFSKGDKLFRGKRWGLTFWDRGFNDFVDFGRFSFFDSICRRVCKEDVKEGMGVDIKVFFSFWEENGEGVFDLGFCFSEFMFKFLDKTGKVTKFRVFRIGFKELGVAKSEESKGFGIFLVVFRGVVGRDKLKESVYDLRVKDEGLDVIFGEEKIKRDMKSTGGFHDDNWVLERVKGVKEGFKAFEGHREVAGSDGLSRVIENAEMKIIFRDVDTYVVLHFATSDLRFLKSLTPSSRVAGAFLAQPTYWVLRDRGTYSFGGSKAYEKWSPCPSLFCKLQPYNITQKVLSKT